MVARLFFVVAWKFHVGAVVCLLGCSMWLLVFWMVVRLFLWLLGYSRCCSGSDLLLGCTKWLLCCSGWLFGCYWWL